MSLEGFKKLFKNDSADLSGKSVEEMEEELSRAKHEMGDLLRRREALHQRRTSGQTIQRRLSGVSERMRLLEEELKKRK